MAAKLIDRTGHTFGTLTVIERAPSRDRVDSTRGYEVDNVVSCCRTCNIAKHDMPYGAFVAWAMRVAGRRGGMV
jgi:hypothetical protein